MLALMQYQDAQGFSLMQNFLDNCPPTAKIAFCDIDFILEVTVPRFKHGFVGNVTCLAVGYANFHMLLKKTLSFKMLSTTLSKKIHCIVQQLHATAIYSRL